MAILVFHHHYNHHPYQLHYYQQHQHTVPALLVAAATIKFFEVLVRLLLESGFY